MPSDRAGWATTLLAIAVVILLGQAIWQQTRVHALRSQLEQLRDKREPEAQARDAASLACASGSDL